MNIPVFPSGLCELSQVCDIDSGAWVGSGNAFGGWRVVLDGRCQNVTEPHKQAPHSQLGRAERKTNRQTGRCQAGRETHTLSSGTQEMCV